MNVESKYTLGNRVFVGVISQDGGERHMKVSGPHRICEIQINLVYQPGTFIQEQVTKYRFDSLEGWHLEIDTFTNAQHAIEVCDHKIRNIPAATPEAVTQAA